jgi:hypothetical protein
VKDNSPARRCAAYYFKLFDQDPKYASLAASWTAIMDFLLKESQLPEDEFKDFLNWAVNENYSEKPTLSSADFLTKARDPADNLKKHAEWLVRYFKAARKSKKAKQAAKTPDWLMRDKLMVENMMAEQRKGGMTGDELRAEMERTGLPMREVLDQHRAKLAAQAEAEKLK